MQTNLKQKIKAGSPALFFFIRIVNTIFLLTAIALIALSIWLWRQFDAFSIVEIVFMLLGVVEALLAVLVFSARKSVVK